jgi:SnoaL-like domain
MAEEMKRVKEILSRWIDDPGSEHPYLLSEERMELYIASQDQWLDPEVELDFATGASLAGLETRGRGREDWWRLWRGWLEAWGEYRFQYTDWEQRQGRVIVVIDIATTGQASGVPVSISGWHVWTLRRDRIAGLHMFGARRAALAAIEGRPG